MDEHLQDSKSGDKSPPTFTGPPIVPTLNLPPPKSPSSGDLFDINSFLSFRETLSPRSPKRSALDLPPFQDFHSDLFLSPRNSKPNVMDQPLPQIHEISSGNSLDSHQQAKMSQKPYYHPNDPRNHSDTLGTTPPPTNNSMNFGFDSPFPSIYSSKVPMVGNQFNSLGGMNQSMSGQNTSNTWKGNVPFNDKDIFKQVDVFGSSLVSKAKLKTENILSPQKNKNTIPYKQMNYPILQQQPQFESLQHLNVRSNIGVKYPTSNQFMGQQNIFPNVDKKYPLPPPPSSISPMMMNQPKFLQLPTQVIPKLPISQLEQKPYLNENPKNNSIDSSQREMVQQILQKKKRPFDVMSQSSGNDLLSQDQKKQKHFLPQTSVQHLKEWFYDHLDHPYPTSDQKENLSKLSGLTYLQVSNWFTNTRKRVWAPSLRLINRDSVEKQDGSIGENSPRTEDGNPENKN